MELIGFFFALLIGFFVGLFGGGGSILSVPVLAYLFLFNEKVATAYSLFIVGVTAMIAGIKQNLRKNVNWKIALIFGVPSLVGVWLVRKFVIPELPIIIFDFYGFMLSRRMLIFGIFILLMFLSSYSIISERKNLISKRSKKINYSWIIFEGLVIGGLTGFVGAGGGFLIIPALIVLTHLDIKVAVGTSLIIIAIKSIIGFLLGDALIMEIDWNFLIFFTSISICGTFLGTYFSDKINSYLLKKGFGYFILLMALVMLVFEFK